MVKVKSKKEQILYGKKFIPTETSQEGMTTTYEIIRESTNKSCRRSRKNYKEVIPDQLDQILNKLEEERLKLIERLNLLKLINDPRNDINSLRGRPDFSEMENLLKDGIAPIHYIGTFQYSEKGCLEKVNQLYENKKFQEKKVTISQILEINEHNKRLSKEIEVEIETTKLRFKGIIFE
jgi:hypothetical protein